MRSLVPLLALSAVPGAVFCAAIVFSLGTRLNARVESFTGLTHHLSLPLLPAAVMFAVPPLLVLLHAFRVRPTRVVVPSTLLWEQALDRRHANQFGMWLREHAMLLLLLAATGFLLEAVLGPTLHGSNAPAGRRYVLLLDNSASMSATDVPPTRLEAARQAAFARIDAASDSDRGAVIAFSRTAAVVQTFTNDRSRLRSAIERIEPTVSTTRFEEALQLAASLGEGAGAVDVDLFSDGAFPSVPNFPADRVRLHYHAVPVPEGGRSANNLAIVHLDSARDRRESGTLQVNVTLRNFRDTPVETQRVRLEIRDANDAVLGAQIQTINLGAGSTQVVTFTAREVPREAILRVRLDNTRDALTLDDEADLVPGPARKARVLVVGGNDVLDAFLDSAGTRALADVTRIAPKDLANPAKYLNPAREGEFDLVIFDRCAPASEADMPRANTFFLGTPPPPFRVPIAGSPGDRFTVSPVANPRITGWKADAPVLRGLYGLSDIAIGEAFRLPELPPRTARLLESTDNLTLLAAIPRQAFTDLVLAFPLVADAGRWNTFWPRQPGFVLFLRNVLRLFGASLDVSLIRPGDTVDLWPRGPSVRVTWPDGQRAETFERGPRAKIPFTGTDALGVYTARSAHETQCFAVNLTDTLESDLAARPTLTLGENAIAAEEPRLPPRALWKFAVLAAVALLLAAWWRMSS